MIPLALMNSTKSVDVNCAPLSDITCSGIRCSVTSTTSAHMDCASIAKRKCLFINGRHNRCVVFAMPNPRLKWSPR